MGISVPNPILTMIKRKSRVLEKLIKQCPTLLEDLKKELSKQIEEEAAQVACGDKEIEASICSSMYVAAFEDDGELQNNFYQSMLLMVVSYYESIITLFAKETRSEDNIHAICTKKSITLSTETRTNIGYIEEEVNALRNNVCHNNFGTPRKRDVLEKIANKSDEIHFHDDVISITGPNYILNVLNKESEILLELADRLGYKNMKFRDGKLTTD